MQKQSRRWVKAWNLRPKEMTENAVTGQEAHDAIIAILMQPGLHLSRIEDYDARKDEFNVLGFSARNSKLTTCRIPGEAVAKLAKAVRFLKVAYKANKAHDALALHPR